jgi:hypothetical protein
MRIRKGDIVRRINYFGAPLGSYLMVTSIIGQGLYKCKYMDCDVLTTSVTSKRIKKFKKCAVKVSADDYTKLKLANIGVYKHVTTPQFDRLEDELPDIVAFTHPGKPTLYYRVGVIYPVMHKCKNCTMTMVELIDLINK